MEGNFETRHEHIKLILIKTLSVSEKDHAVIVNLLFLL
jgi:hypothetical protein